MRTWSFATALQSSRRRFRSVPACAGFLVAALIPFALAGCDGESRASSSDLTIGGNARHGVALIQQYGCGSCHVIPGVAAADGLVGPPLTQMARRVYIAGIMRNTPDNMIAWLRDPQAFVLGNAMPSVGLDEQAARDITAYLATLR